MNKEEALEIYETKWWEDATNQEIVAFQLFEKRLCMPFGRFHEAVEKVFHRPVYTHEFAFAENLKAEYLTQRPPTTLGESLAMLREKFPDLKIFFVASRNET